MKAGELGERSAFFFLVYPNISLTCAAVCRIGFKLGFAVCPFSC